MEWPFSCGEVYLYFFKFMGTQQATSLHPRYLLNVFGLSLHPKEKDFLEPFCSL
jgi:hypothetical protein